MEMRPYGRRAVGSFDRTREVRLLVSRCHSATTVVRDQDAVLGAEFIDPGGSGFFVEDAQM